MCLPRRKTPHSESHCCPPVTPDLRRGRVRPQIGVTRCQIPDASDFLVFFCFTVFSSFFGHVCTDLSPLSKLVVVHTPPLLTRVWLSSVCRPFYASLPFFGALYLLWHGPLTFLWNEMCSSGWIWNFCFFLAFVCVCVCASRFCTSPQVFC